MTREVVVQPAGEQPDRAPANPESEKPLDVLFVMRSSDSLRFFQSALELLAERGHRVRLLLWRAGSGRGEQAWLEEMVRRPNFSCDDLDRVRAGAWYRRGVTMRMAVEYVRYLMLGHARSTAAFRIRLSRAPEKVQRLAALPLVRTRPGLYVLYAIMRAFERALPVPPEATEYLAGQRPDLLALCDHMRVGSLLSMYARAAKERGIPVATCVVSWDRLSKGQQLRVLPHVLLVWNDRQLREAVEIHGVPAERVIVTGAPSFDKWFSWRPRPRTEFLRRVGLDPEKPVILWVGSLLSETERTEAGYVATWLDALRSVDDPVLSEVGVLLRPHPYRAEAWLAADFSGFENVSLWPRRGLQMPVGQEQRSDFYDSIFHAFAVVGINTSAMIEAAIVGRPVLTILEEDFHDSQLGAFHFSYLLESSGGMLRVARSLDENFDHLSAILAGRDAEAAEQAQRFVADFVRPHGLEREATPIFAEALEKLGRTRVPRERDPIWARVLRGLIRLGYVVRELAAGMRRRALQAAAGVSRAIRIRLGRTLSDFLKRVRHALVVWPRAAVRARAGRLRRRFDRE